MQSKKAWKGTTGGGKFGQGFLFFFFKHVDVRVGYFFMLFTIPFYMLFKRADFQAIYHFLRDRIGNKPSRAFFGTFKTYAKFGQVVLDKFALLAGAKNRFKITVEGLEHFDKLITDDKGFIIAGAHVGNFEIAGYLLKQDIKRINSLVYSGETEQLQKKRAGLLAAHNINMIPVLPDMSHLFIVKQALDQGEIVSMLCDRLYSDSKYLTVSLLGKNAKFPVGPFHTAIRLNVPFLAIFVMKTSMTHYTIHLQPIQNNCSETITNKNIDDKNQLKSKINITNNQNDKIQNLANQYVNTLENICKLYPNQWYNFYEFWEV